MFRAQNPDGEDNDSTTYNVNNDTMLRKVTQKQNTINNFKSRNKHKSKNTAKFNFQTDNKDNKIVSHI